MMRGRLLAADLAGAESGLFGVLGAGELLLGIGVEEAAAGLVVDVGALLGGDHDGGLLRILGRDEAALLVTLGSLAGRLGLGRLLLCGCLHFRILRIN